MSGLKSVEMNWEELISPWEDRFTGGEVVRVFGVDFVKYDRGDSWQILDNEELSPGNGERAKELINNGNFGSLHDMERFIDRLLCLKNDGKWEIPDNDEILKMLDLVFHVYRIKRNRGTT